MTRVGVALLLGGLLASCGGKSDPLDVLKHATAVPGEGLGEIYLGVEHLGPFVDRFGMGQPSGAFTDEDTTVWVFYPNQQIHFAFLLNEPCYEATRMQGPQVVRAMFDPSSFFADYPDCRDATLSSILIGTRSRGESWWQGSTLSGTRLGDAWPEVLAKEGTPQHQGGAYLPLLQTQGQELESLRYSAGMEVYFIYRDVGQTAVEVDRLGINARYIDIVPGHSE